MVSISSILQIRKLTERLNKLPKETGFEHKQPNSRAHVCNHLASVGADLLFREVPFSSFLPSISLSPEPSDFLMGFIWGSERKKSQDIILIKLVAAWKYLKCITAKLYTSVDSSRVLLCVSSLSITDPTGLSQ